jgi:hypothetical protein
MRTNAAIAKNIGEQIWIKAIVCSLTALSVAPTIGSMIVSNWSCSNWYCTGKQSFWVANLVARRTLIDTIRALNFLSLMKMIMFAVRIQIDKRVTNIAAIPACPNPVAIIPKQTTAKNEMR